MTEQDVYYRFMGAVRAMKHKQAQPLVILDFEEKLALAAVVGDDESEEFVGVARWFLDRATNMAEVAFTVSPDWQGQGLGTKLLACLVEVARQKGIRGFTADVLGANRKMQHLFFKSGFDVHSQLVGGTYSISFRFDQPRRAPA